MQIQLTRNLHQKHLGVNIREGAIALAVLDLQRTQPLRRVELASKSPHVISHFLLLAVLFVVGFFRFPVLTTIPAFLVRTAPPCGVVGERRRACVEGVSAFTRLFAHAVGLVELGETALDLRIHAALGVQLEVVQTVRTELLRLELQHRNDHR